VTVRIRLRWGWRVGMLAALGSVLVVAFVLSFSGSAPSLYERELAWLFWLNFGLALLLAIVLVLTIGRLLLRLRAGRFGSRLLLRLAGIFALVGVLPGIVIYTVSYQFAARSIESWFDEQLASALDAGLSLGKGTLESLQAQALDGTASAAGRLSLETRAITAVDLERERERIGVRELALVDGSGQVLLVASGASRTVVPERPGATLLRQARSAGQAGQIEGLEDDGGLGPRVRSLVVVPAGGFAAPGAEQRLLFAVYPLPRPLVANALKVQAAYSEYQQRALAREALRRLYIGTLTLALVLTVFGAILLAVVLGNQIVRPLLMLADGVREVASGNLSSRPVFKSEDELGGLTRSFAAMTQQVAEARAQAQGSLAQLESARTRLQTILDNLTPGVIVLDHQGRIETVNPGATRILRQPLQAYVGRGLQEVPELTEMAQAVTRRFEGLLGGAEEGSGQPWQDAFVLQEGRPDAVTLLARGVAMPGQMRLLVFDDITEVVSAQRAQAWAEVARRLAHEIKNPLTPIQLSAERLQHKLESRLEEGDRALLVRSVGTIVAQVEAMKALVNEFRDFARLPSAQLAPLSLNDTVAEVLGLYGQEQEQGRLRARLDAKLPQVMGDATQLRQVVHNLVQNALDAVSARPDGQVTVITLSSEVPTGQAGPGSRVVRLVVTDNGPGFAEHVLKRAFEPYVTTKPRGTGLGLAVVKKIADEHGARIRLSNLQAAGDALAPVSGARVSLSFSSLQPPDDGSVTRRA
jgi:nitrogen fixation/metabolism regulation signal transduction histidine kinase